MPVRNATSRGKGEGDLFVSRSCPRKWVLKDLWLSVTFASCLCDDDLPAVRPCRGGGELRVQLAQGRNGNCPVFLARCLETSHPDLFSGLTGGPDALCMSVCDRRCISQQWGGEPRSLTGSTARSRLLQRSLGGHAVCWGMHGAAVWTAACPLLMLDANGCLT